MKKFLICVMMFLWCGIAVADEWTIYKEVIEELEKVREIAVIGVEYNDYLLAIILLTVKASSIDETVEIDPAFSENAQASYYFYLKAEIDWALIRWRNETDYEEIVEESWTAASIELDEAIAIYEALGDPSKTPPDIDKDDNNKNTAAAADSGGEDNGGTAADGNGYSNGSDDIGYCFIGGLVSSF